MKKIRFLKKISIKFKLIIDDFKINEDQKQIDLKNIQSYEEEPEIKRLRLAKEEKNRLIEEQNIMKIQAERVNWFFIQEYEEKLLENQRRLKDLENKKLTTDFEGNVILIKNVVSNKLASEFVQPTYNYNKKSTSQIKENMNDRGSSENKVVQISHDKPNKQYHSEIHNILTKNSPESTQEGSDRKVIQPIGSNFEFDLI